jgi:hypothetical protein
MVRGIFVFLIFLFAALQAQAATVGNVQGTVQIGSGPEAVAISSPTPIETGNVIRTGPDSSATVYFENGCSAVLSSNQTLTIPDNPSCQGDTLSTGIGAQALVIGGLVVAGGAALALGGGGGSSSP